jgi:peroxiredoxin
MQLVELQGVHAELERAGYAILGITYDAQAGLKAFAEKHGIDYPLLSDDGSRVIRELGILDEDLEAHHARFGVPTRADQHGVAYPMTFVLDEQGRVERKIVEEQYRSRYAGRWLLEELTGVSAGATLPDAQASTASAGIVSARASLDSPRYFAYQRLGLHLELTIASGWHIYGPVVPSGYTGLQIEAESDPPGVMLGTPRWPETRPFRVEGLDELFNVYERTLDVTVPLDFIVNRGSGPVRLEISVRFQACSETECLPPASLALPLTVPEAPVP